MPTLEEVQAQIKMLGEVDTFGTKKEVRYLPDILTNDESILSLTSGIMDGNTWLIVCTERRVIFLDKGMIYGLKQRETPLEKINSVEQKTGIMFGSIGIWDGAARMEIKNVIKGTVGPFVETVNRAREALKVADASKGNDVTSQLERLASLRERGILTDEEFQAQKTSSLACEGRHCLTTVSTRTDNPAALHCQPVILLASTFGEKNVSQKPLYRK